MRGFGERSQKEQRRPSDSRHIRPWVFVALGVLLFAGLGISLYINRTRSKALQREVAGLRQRMEEIDNKAETARTRATEAEQSARQAATAKAQAESKKEAAEAEAKLASQKADEAQQRASVAEKERQEAVQEAERIRKEREEELNRLQEALQKIAETRRTAMGLVMNLDSNAIQFEFNKAVLLSMNRELLSRIAGILLTSKGYSITVYGHTDDVGSEAYNQELSERRAQAVRDYLVANFPDYGDPWGGTPPPADAAGIFIDVHSFGMRVMWSWGHTNTQAPNGTQLQTLGRKYAYFNNHTPHQAIFLYVTDGTTRDYGYGELGVATYTFELGTAFFQDCSTFENVILPTNMQALLYAARVTRAPYMLPAGPDALSVATVPPGSVNTGQPLDVTSVVNDTHYNNTNGTEPVQPIAAAEVYLDTPPWSPGATPVALAAVDGAYDETVEPVTGTLSTAGWAVGRHTLFVRGRDSANNWGPVSAVFVDVVVPVELQSFVIQ